MNQQPDGIASSGRPATGPRRLQRLGWRPPLPWPVRGNGDERAVGISPVVLSPLLFAVLAMTVLTTETVVLGGFLLIGFGIIVVTAWLLRQLFFSRGSRF